MAAHFRQKRPQKRKKSRISGFPDWLLFGGIALGMYLYAGSNQPDVVVPPAPEAPDLGPLLPTARHVVDGCDEVALRVDNRRTLPVSVQTFAQADVAVLSAAWKRKPLASDLKTERRIGEPGFFFGFPQGRPGEVVGSLIARNRMRVRGRYSSDEAILAWSELGRSRGLRGSLGGLSGAPVLDADGEIIGIVSAEAPRRGRVYTVAPRYLRGLITEQSGAPEPLSLDSFSLSADRLRRERRIAQVLCFVE